MPKHTDRVRIEEVDWSAVLPWLRLFAAVRASLHPAKLLTALLLVVVLFLTGQALDLAFGKRVHAGEFDAYRQAWHGAKSSDDLDDWMRLSTFVEHEAPTRTLQHAGLLREPKELAAFDAITDPAARFAEARRLINSTYAKRHADATKDRELLPGDIDWEARFADLRHARAEALEALAAIEPTGPFDASLDAASAAVNGHDDEASVLARLNDIFVVLPAWLWDHHRGFLILYLTLALLIGHCLGGAITRMAALHATRDERIGLRSAVAFAAHHGWSFLLAPLIPLAVVAVVAGLLALGGLVFFGPKEWAIDIIGGVFFIAAILCGFIIAATLLLSALGFHLVYPAIAVDGADVFDAYARAFHYLLNRAVRWFFYTLLALVAGVVTYLLIMLILFLTLWAAHRFAGLWLSTETTMGGQRWDILFPPPRFGDLNHDIDFAALDWSAKIAAGFIRAWTYITAALLAAFAVSYYFTAHTWIYLLLRKNADGIEVEDVTAGQEEGVSSGGTDKAARGLVSDRGQG